MKFLIGLILFISPLFGSVTCLYDGQLGNVFFQMAAAISLAYDNECPLYLSEITEGTKPNFFPYPKGSPAQEYMKAIYSRVATLMPLLPSMPPIQKVHENIGPIYAPIPYEPNIRIHGYFQCEKYFKHNSYLIRRLFRISEPIETYLQEHFPDILSHPKTVGIHVRTYFPDLKRDHVDIFSFYASWMAPDLSFIQQAIEQFDDDALFIVCSDYPKWCQKNFLPFNRNFVFIENQEAIYDFFLLTKCKHNIIAASSFGWWAAYLNEHPKKQVIYRNPFYNANPDDPINHHFQVAEWTAIDMPPYFPLPPVFD